MKVTRHPLERECEARSGKGPVDSLMLIATCREDGGLSLVFAALVVRPACMPACGMVMGRLKVPVR